MKKANKERRIVNRIVRELSKSKNPELIVAEVARTPYRDKPEVIDTPEKAAKAFNHIRDKKQEHFAVLTMDYARQYINCHVVTIGTLSQALVHPREVFALALEDRAASIIIAHNHPSGNLDISGQDRKVTDIMKKAGDIMNIPVDDHLIVTEHEFVSVPGEWKKTQTNSEGSHEL